MSVSTTPSPASIKWAEATECLKRLTPTSTSHVRRRSGASVYDSEVNHLSQLSLQSKSHSHPSSPLPSHDRLKVRHFSDPKILISQRLDNLTETHEENPCSSSTIKNCEDVKSHEENQVNDEVTVIDTKNKKMKDVIRFRDLSKEAADKLISVKPDIQPDEIVRAIRCRINVRQNGEYEVEVPGDKAMSLKLQKLLQSRLGPKIMPPPAPSSPPPPPSSDPPVNPSL